MDYNIDIDIDSPWPIVDSRWSIAPEVPPRRTNAPRDHSAHAWEGVWPHKDNLQVAFWQRAYFYDNVTYRYKCNFWFTLLSVWHKHVRGLLYLFLAQAVLMESVGCAREIQIQTSVAFGAPWGGLRGASDE